MSNLHITINLPTCKPLSSHLPVTWLLGCSEFLLRQAKLLIVRVDSNQFSRHALIVEEAG